MPRKRRRTAWTAASEASSFNYASADTEMTLLSSGVFRIARTEKPARQLQFNSDDIADFPHNHASQHQQQPNYPTMQTPHPPADPEDLAVLSFGSDGISPAKPPLPHEGPDPIHESPVWAPPPAQGTPSQHGLSVAPSPTPPTAFVARSLLSAMDQAGPTPDSRFMRSASKPSIPRNEDKTSTPLMIATSEIRRAQRTLGLSPDTPGSSALKFLDPELERELREVQNSTRKMMLDVDDPSPLSKSTPHDTPLMKGPKSDAMITVDPNSAKRQPARKKKSAQHPAGLPQAGTTPVKFRRRLSDMSTVTPIPLNLESPVQAKEGELGLDTAKLGDAHLPDTAAPLFMTGKGVPLGIPLFTNGKCIPVQTPSAPKKVSSPLTPRHRNSDNEENLGKNPAIGATSRPRPTVQPVSAPVASLFTPGKGVPLQAHGALRPALPPNHVTLSKPTNSALPCPPLFTTGSGKQLDTPPLKSGGSTSLQKNAGISSSLFMTGSGKNVDIPQSLFMTGSGRKVQIPALLQQGSGFANSGDDLAPPIFTTGSGRKVNVSSKPKYGSEPPRKGFEMSALFSTGRGNAVPLPMQGNVSNHHVRLHPSPLSKEGGQLFSTPLREPFKEACAQQAREKEKRGCALKPKPVELENRRIRTQSMTRTALKSTPFKRPRQLWRPEKTPEKSAAGHKPLPRPVPNISVPKLLKSGRLQCQVPQHECSSRVSANSCNSPDFLLRVGCLRHCLGFSFTNDTYGDVSCLSEEVKTALDFDSIDEFGIQNCITWMKTLFPAMSQKPASCVGSEAWTKLSYSLAVWKLGRLDLARTEGYRFLCAANIVREFLRRMSFEWHNNRQPHLLRMMRRDSAPASHVVLVIADIEEDKQKRLLLTVSDGWYVARAVIDPILEKRVLKGQLRIGEKVHVVGAGLQSVSVGREFFCGDGDELCASMLRICVNNLRKQRNNLNEHLGIQRSPLFTDSLRWVRDDGGLCPTVRAVVLRSYPIFYMETVASPEQNDVGDEEAAPEYLFRREDAEFEARAAFEESFRQKLMMAAEQNERFRGRGADEMEMQRRDVRSVKEVLVCGIRDDPRDPSVRKTVRIYNPTQDVQTFLAHEGQVIIVSQLWPKRNRWTGKPEGILPPRRKLTSDRLSRFPRKICSILELQSSALATGTEFDGVFIVLHVSGKAEVGERRFAYFADDVGNGIRVLALEMSAADMSFLPKALRMKTRYGPKFPAVVLQNVEYQAVSAMHDLVHARASLRTSFASSQALSRRGALKPLKDALVKVEEQMSGKETQLEILKEAVISFASGTRGSIGAYFTSTQDM